MSDFIVEHLTKSVGDKTVFANLSLSSIKATVSGLLGSMVQERRLCWMSCQVASVLTEMCRLFVQKCL